VRQLSAEHIAALLVTAAAAVASVRAVRRRPARRGALRGALGAAILVAYLAEHATYAARGEWRVEVNLPLHLTDAVTLAAVLALWRPRPLLVEVVFFWALTASVQALLTPDLGASFPDPLFLTFFVTHGGAVVAACLLVLGLGRLPRPWALWRVYGLTAALAGIAGLADVLTGGNYMYLRHPPDSASLLDLLGPWPWYVVGAAAIALALFAVLEALAAALRRRAARPNRDPAAAPSRTPGPTTVR
jgi:hypothetical integral membrane protein (TIGR02206 family)